MYDSTVAADIPADAEVVAGYVNGRNSEWASEDWQHFPTAQAFRIDVDGTQALTADILDIENGDATPAMAPGWIDQREAAGIHVHRLYFEASKKNEVEAACEGRQYLAWIADWTGEPHMPDGAAACQYASPSTGSPGHYDLSVCTTNWLTGASL